MDLPTKEVYDKAVELVNKYKLEMMKKEAHDTALRMKKFQGRCFRFGSMRYLEVDQEGHHNGDGNPLTFGRVMVVDDRGYAILAVQYSGGYGYGDGLTIESKRWPFGMEFYFRKQITPERFKKEFAKAVKRLSPTASFDMPEVQMSE